MREHPSTFSTFYVWPVSGIRGSVMCLYHACRIMLVAMAYQIQEIVCPTSDTSPYHANFQILDKKMGEVKHNQCTQIFMFLIYMLIRIYIVHTEEFLTTPLLVLHLLLLVWYSLPTGGKWTSDCLSNRQVTPPSDPDPFMLKKGRWLREQNRGQKFIRTKQLVRTATVWIRYTLIRLQINNLISSFQFKPCSQLRQYRRQWVRWFNPWLPCWSDLY